MNDIEEYRKFGEKYLGPFLYAFTDWLYKKIADAGLKKVFFFARDGYLMEKAFRCFAEYYAFEIEIKYVYFSRKSIRQTFFWRCQSYEESLQYIHKQKRYISIGGILDYYGFDDKEKYEIADKYLINLDKEILLDFLKSNGTIKKLYENIKNRIDEKSKIQDDLLAEYIKNIELEGDCAIVDIGWAGRMQNYLEKYLQTNNISANLAGYYVGIDPIVPIKGTVDGFLYSPMNNKNRKSILCFLGGYEKIFQSQEGSTLGYQRKGKTIVVLHSKYEFEENKNFETYISTWQNAALNFVKHSLIQKKPASEKMTKSLIRFGKYPTLREVEMLAFLYNDDGKNDFFVSQKNLWQYTPKDLIHSISDSAWKTGFMKSVFKLPLPYYFIYYLLKK